MDFEFSDRCKELRERLLAFMDDHVYPDRVRLRGAARASRATRTPTRR